jgi:hypothetical protein
VRLVFIVSVSLVMALAGCSGETSESPSEDGERISEPPSERPSEGAPTGSPRARTVYVPAYSHLPANNGRKHLLSILLSVRNMDSSAVVTLTHVDYFDTSGHRVRRYLSSPRELRPLETVEFTVETLDEVGGSGANFLIDWEGPSDAHPLLTETIMWGHVGTGYISFKSRGVELDRRPDPTDFMMDEPPPAAAPPEDESSQGVP